MIEITIEVNRALRLYNIMLTLRLTLDIVTLVITEPDPYNISVINGSFSV